MRRWISAHAATFKDSAILEVAQGLLAVARGQHYVSAPLTVQLLNRNRQVESFKQGDAGLSELEANTSGESCEWWLTINRVKRLPMSCVFSTGRWKTAAL